jgi:hypothetical protein
MNQPHVSQMQPIPFRYNSKTDLLIDFESSSKDLRVFLDLVVIEEKDEWSRHV